MNKNITLFSAVAAVLIIVGGCTTALPLLKPSDPFRKQAAIKDCLRPFLTEKYRLVHSLKATLPGGSEGTAVGVLVADPQRGHFQSVLMTIEGLVLFDIVYGEDLIVNRAVPPFDDPAFARRMAEDIGLAFFPPGNEPAGLGLDERGASVCRFERPGGGFVDVRSGETGVAEVILYGAGQDLLKYVRIRGLDRPGLADELEIRGNEWPSYGLRMQLLEAEPVED